MSRPNRSVLSGRDILGSSGTWLGRLLGRLPPGLVLDVGAGFGFFSRMACRSNANLRILAFEPFSGNWNHFVDNIAGLGPGTGEDARVSFADRVRLRRVAVSDRSGEAMFHVASTVTADAPSFWRDLPGYSSLGRISGHPDSAPVPCTTVDDELSGATASFMKIDVQGAEPAVLRGAEASISAGRILGLLVEYRGQPEILDVLCDYEAIACEWTVFLDPESATPVRRWHVTGERVLSTGRPAVSGWPRDHRRRNFDAYFRRVAKRFFHVETDLLFIHRSRTDLLRGLAVD